MADGAPTKKILVTLQVVEIEVPEDLPTDEVSSWLDTASLLIQSQAAWSTWKYADEWRD